jgi:P pilus assembly chaperone PapD
MIRTAGFCALLALLPSSSLAGSFRITPVRVLMDGEKNISVVKLKNEAEENLLIQVRALKWSQDGEGHDQYEPTEEVIFFPRILPIPVGEEKPFRLGVEGGTPTNQERAYRIVFEELPVLEPGENKLVFALSIRVPVFVPPHGRKSAVPRLERVGLAKGHVQVGIRNEGNISLSVNKIDAKGAGADGTAVFAIEGPGGYLHPGKKRDFAVELDPSKCAISTTIDVTVTYTEMNADPETKESSTRAGKLEVDPAFCAKPPEEEEKGSRSGVDEPPPVPGGPVPGALGEGDKK